MSCGLFRVFKLGRSGRGLGFNGSTWCKVCMRGEGQMIDTDPSLGIHHEDQCLARCTTFCDDGGESEVVAIVHEMCCGRGENTKR